jgi:hypothetical protein
VSNNVSPSASSSDGNHLDTTTSAEMPVLGSRFVVVGDINFEGCKEWSIAKFMVYILRKGVNIDAAACFGPTITEKNKSKYVKLLKSIQQKIAEPERKYFKSRNLPSISDNFMARNAFIAHGQTIFGTALEIFLTERIDLWNEDPSTKLVRSKETQQLTVGHLSSLCEKTVTYKAKKHATSPSSMDGFLLSRPK